MIKAVLRPALPVAALLVVGPLLALPVASLTNAAGGSSTTFLVSNSPVLGAVIGIFTLLVAAVLGVIGARAFDFKAGALLAGLTIAWIAWRTGNMLDVHRVAPGSATLITMAIEAAALGIVGLAAVRAMQVAAPREPKPEARPTDDLDEGSLKDPASLAVVAASAVAALVVAMLVAQTAMRGQALAAAWAGGVAAGAMMSVVAPALSRRPTPNMAYAGMLLAAVAAPIVAMFMGGNDTAAVLQRAVPGLALIQPVDWVAGSLLGVGVGIGWFDSAAASSASEPAKA